jgi:hypothetical protein
MYQPAGTMEEFFRTANKFTNQSPKENKKFTKKHGIRIWVPPSTPSKGHKVRMQLCPVSGKTGPELASYSRSRTDMILHGDVHFRRGAKRWWFEVSGYYHHRQSCISRELQSDRSGISAYSPEVP